MTALAIPPVAMTSREIADLTGKRHKNVIRDAKAMTLELYGREIVERRITDDMRLHPSIFIRENVDALISELCGDGPSWSHPSGGVSLTRDTRGYVAGFSFDQSHSYTLVSGYDVVMRKRIIDRWIELETAARQPAPSDRRIAALEARVAALEARRPPAKPDIADRILAFVRKRGEVSKSELLRTFRDVSAAECNATLARLQADGQLAVIVQSAHRIGRPTTTCRVMQ